ncbi:LysM peptidoglycan-binding domain-containing M23 family metallopeptidase [Streptomyces sp. WMMC500]|uniref:LysM peptidoglycan-binding domain-containing M23 family metallopeptidase n=1 Tax=Streptomyces sp. WMMC500 TaxID=3015154 RepID=UPI00248A9F71|nr:LysM peptidoglycan-binding domain-containing M23 family metallopeptidase [Streptomyces sp. WMMC500]WBB58352.1 LysM peptidoglycan-binding domain-containing M23 family metallopeptidase [Streptomyces sp. WMMC500]
MSTRRHHFPRKRRTVVAVVLAALLAALTGASAAGAAGTGAAARVTAAGAPPAPAPRAVAAPADPAPTPYRVREGDNLTGIARRMGVPTQHMYEANRSVIGADPDVLRPGQVLLAPAPGWAPPVTVEYRISARYGLPGDGWIAGYHTGVDLAVPTGTPVYSVGPGEVHSTSTEGAYGNHILIRMSDGHYVLYAHLDRMSVAAGDRVTGGTRIGDAGSTGNATGPHLHLEVRKGTDYGTDVDPVAYAATYGIRI